MNKVKKLIRPEIVYELEKKIKTMAKTNNKCTISIIDAYYYLISQFFLYLLILALFEN